MLSFATANLTFHSETRFKTLGRIPPSKRSAWEGGGQKFTFPRTGWRGLASATAALGFVHHTRVHQYNPWPRPDWETYGSTIGEPRRGSRATLRAHVEMESDIGEASASLSVDTEDAARLGLAPQRPPQLLCYSMHMELFCGIQGRREQVRTRRHGHATNMRAFSYQVSQSEHSEVPP